MIEWTEWAGYAGYAEFAECHESPALGPPCSKWPVPSLISVTIKAYAEMPRCLPDHSQLLHGQLLRLAPRVDQR